MSQRSFLHRSDNLGVAPSEPLVRCSRSSLDRSMNRTVDAASSCVLDWSFVLQFRLSRRRAMIPRLMRYASWRRSIRTDLRGKSGCSRFVFQAGPEENHGQEHQTGSREKTKFVGLPRRQPRRPLCLVAVSRAGRQDAGNPKRARKARK
jgi:hypothetical protein